MDPEIPNEALPRAEAPERLPVVAIVGRPNAGKSTLFNRLVRRQRALVDSRPGVTRDRNITMARWEGRAYLLVDTGGFDDQDRSSLAVAMRRQALIAAEDADAVIVLLDGREGVNPSDRDLVQRVRRLSKPVLYAVNKLDNPALDDTAADFFGLGVDAVFPISAAHGRGIGELMEQLLGQLPSPSAPDGVATEREGQEDPVRLAIIGRPNVGKSSLLNCLVGYERAVVSETPGTTRDTLDTPLSRRGRDYVLVDTAGIRRRPKVHDQLERGSVVRALRALEGAEVALLVFDATTGMTDQDARIAGYAWERGRALLFVANKWDAVPRAERDRARLVASIADQYQTLAEVPAVCVSALTGNRVAAIFPALEQLTAAHRRQVRTPDLNRVLLAAQEAQAAPSTRGKRSRLFYAAQTATRPPTFTVFCSAPELLPVSYQRYLANAVRRAFELQGTPLRLRFRGRDRPKR